MRNTGAGLDWEMRETRVSTQDCTRLKVGRSAGRPEEASIRARFDPAKLNRDWLP